MGINGCQQRNDSTGIRRDCWLTSWLETSHRLLCLSRLSQPLHSSRLIWPAFATTPAHLELTTPHKTAYRCPVSPCPTATSVAEEEGPQHRPHRSCIHCRQHPCLTAVTRCRKDRPPDDRGSTPWSR